MALQRKPVYPDTFGTMADQSEEAQTPTENSNNDASASEGKANSTDSLTAQNESTNQQPSQEIERTDSSKEYSDENDRSVTTDVAEEAHTPFILEKSLSESVVGPESKQEAVLQDTSVSHQELPTDSTATSRETTEQRRLVTTSRGTQARQRVKESFLLARRRPDEWGPAPIRLTKSIKYRLDQRRAQDHRQLGHKFSLNHYHNAALVGIPDDLEEAIRWAEDYIDELGLSKPETVGTTTRLHHPVAERMTQLSSDLPARARFGLLWYLQTAAVKRLLDALDVHDIGAVDLDG